MVNAASVAGVAPLFALPAAEREDLPSTPREVIYRAVPAEERITSRIAAAASTYERCQNPAAGLPSCALTASLSRSIAERMCDQASAGGSMDLGSSPARARILFRPSTSLAQISQTAI